MTADGSLGAADHLVLAAGSQPNFFGVTGAAEHAFPLYSVTDAERLRLHLKDQLRLHCYPDRADPAPLNVVIVGGGCTGVEVAGAIAELFDVLFADGRLPTKAAVHLVDHGKAVLAPFSEKSHEYALDKLNEYGVQVTFGVAVTEVDPGIGHAVRRHRAAHPDRHLGRRRIGVGDRRGRRREAGPWRPDRRRRRPLRPRLRQCLGHRRCREHPGPRRPGAAATRLGRPAVRQMAGKNIRRVADGRRPSRSITGTKASWR